MRLAFIVCVLAALGGSRPVHGADAIPAPAIAIGTVGLGHAVVPPAPTPRLPVPIPTTATADSSRDVASASGGTGRARAVAPKRPGPAAATRRSGRSTRAKLSWQETAPGEHGAQDPKALAKEVAVAIIQELWPNSATGIRAACDYAGLNYDSYRKNIDYHLGKFSTVEHIRRFQQAPPTSRFEQRYYALKATDALPSYNVAKAVGTQPAAKELSALGPNKHTNKRKVSSTGVSKPRGRPRNSGKKSKPLAQKQTAKAASPSKPEQRKAAMLAEETAVAELPSTERERYKMAYSFAPKAYEKIGSLRQTAEYLVSARLPCGPQHKFTAVICSTVALQSVLQGPV